MMALFRCPLVSITALAVYLAANVGVRELHHHAPESRLPATASFYGDDPQLAPSAETDNDSDSHSCPICSVLSQAQAVPVLLQVETVYPRAGRAATATAVVGSWAIQTAIHSRAPPVC